MKEDISMFTAEIPFSLIGKNYDGDTYALIYKVAKNRIVNKDAKEWLNDGYSLEASVRMQYMDISIAVKSNNPDYAKENADYEKFYPMIANIDEFDDEVVYFLEDDYLHLDGSRTALLEAIDRADYVTLYDAPDKYVPARMGGNPYIEDDGADPTRVILTKSRHWRLTNSTTMTFATRVKTLREDNDVWKQFTEGNHPHDFQAFLALRAKGRALLSPIPTLSTHCEPAWAAPLVDWSLV
jgi:hypothetical protein